MVGFGVVACTYVLFPKVIASVVFPLVSDYTQPEICGNWFTCFWALVFIVLEINHLNHATVLVVLSALLGMVSTVILYGSLQLDFVDSEDGRELKKPMYLLLSFYVLNLFLMILINANWGDLSSVAYAISMLLMSFITGPILLPLTLASVFASILCLPRAVVFWRTSSTLKDSYDRGAGHQKFEAATVISGLEQEASSHAEARALRKQVAEAKEDADHQLNALRVEQVKLSASIEEDTKRMEEAAELSRKMAEIEDLKIQNARLRKELKKNRKFND